MGPELAARTKKNRLVPLAGASKERITGAGVVFETRHPSQSALHYHRHGSSFVTIVLDGSYTEVRDGVPIACAAGTIVFHTASEEHADYFSRAARCLNIEIADGLTDALASAEPFEASIREVVRHFYGTRDEGDLGLEGAVIALQGILAPRESGPNPPVPDWLRPALQDFDWIDAVPLSRAAALAGVHHTHFSRTFHHHLGVTPNEYRRRARLRLASDLLLGSTISLAQVGLRCGFADQSHFTRTFTTATGIPPSTYRRVFAR